MIIPYTSTFVRLSHLYQKFCVHCIVIMNDGGMGAVGVGWFTSWCGWGGGGGTECRYYLIVCFYLWFCLLVSHVLFLFSVSREHDSYCVCFFVYCFFSLSPVPLTGSYWGIEIVVSVMQHYL